MKLAQFHTDDGERAIAVNPMHVVSVTFGDGVVKLDMGPAEDWGDDDYGTRNVLYVAGTYQNAIAILNDAMK